MHEKVIIISAPSGAGKTSIIKQLLQKVDKLAFSVSATSRAIRNGETDGRDYYFLTTSEFKEKILKNEFVEWEEVYPGQFYGTLQSELNRIWEQGNCVLFDVDVKGGINLKKIFGKQALSIFIMPPSVDELRKRLENRHTENSGSLEKRIAKAEFEITFSKHFDKVVVNDKLEKATEEVYNNIKTFMTAE